MQKACCSLLGGGRTMFSKGTEGETAAEQTIKTAADHVIGGCFIVAVSLPGGDVGISPPWCELELFDAGDFVACVHDGLLQHFVGHICGEGANCVLICQRYNRADTFQLVESFGCVAYAVGAHHAFNVNGLSHFIRLLCFKCM